jgi:ABC-2 type transport system permease protein
MTDGTGVIGTGVVSAGPVTGRGRATRAAVRAGLNHGWIELKHCFTMLEDTLEILPIPLVSVAILLAVNAKHKLLPGTHTSLGSTILAGMVVVNVGLNGIIGLGVRLTAEREDGTLLRAKATPNGMLGYLTGRIVVVSGTIMLTVVSLLLVGLVPSSGLALGRTATWLTLAWVLALGLLATLPFGAVLGSLFPSTRSGVNVIMIGTFGLAAISGILYPITQLPTWLQWAGQACDGAIPASEGQNVSEVVYNRIAMLRAERGVSRRQLADALGVHYQTIGYLERSEYSPSLYLALRIAEYFEIPVEVIFSTVPFPRLGSGKGSASA